jgi:HrpA-like RNA helicase
VVADICMYMVRHALRRRCDLKVLLMSATLDSEGFAAYFQNLKDVSWFRQAPLFIFGGQQYDVKEWHLNKLPSNLRDLTSVNKLISNLTTTKVPATDLILIHAVGDIVRRLAACGESVLVFLPGSREILEVDGFLLEHSPDLVTYSMHSSFAEEDVRAAFVEVPRNEKRVILASSIAESSLTIPGVVRIVDCCISRINTESDLNGMQVFDNVWSSNATLVQRRGRTGRVCNGNCLHMLPQIILDLVQGYQYCPPTVEATAKAILYTMSSSGYVDTYLVLSQLYHKPLCHVVQTAGMQLGCIGATKPITDAVANAEDPLNFSDCSLTALGNLSLRLNLGVRRCNFLILALALGKAKIGVLMVACMEVGDPFEMQHQRGLHKCEAAELKAKAVWLKHEEADKSDSDLCARNP